MFPVSQYEASGRIVAKVVQIFSCELNKDVIFCTRNKDAEDGREAGSNGLWLQLYGPLGLSPYACLDSHQRGVVMSARVRFISRQPRGWNKCYLIPVTLSGGGHPDTLDH